MNNLKHCRICDHRIYDVIEGSTCGLTNDRPDFKDKCNDIKLDRQLEQQIDAANIKYDKIKRHRTFVLINFVFYLLIGSSVIVAGYLLGKYAFEKGVISTVPLIIMGVGVTVFPIATTPLYNFFQKIKIAKGEKNELDGLLIKYNTRYHIDFDIRRDLHGNEEYATKITYSR